MISQNQKSETVVLERTATSDAERQSLLRP